MTALTDYAKNILASALVGRQPSLPVAVWVALGTGGSDATGLTGEPAAASGYTRQPATFTGTGTQTNVAQVKFTFTSGVGTLTHLGIYDAGSAGNPLAYAPLGTPATLNSAGSITIPVASLTVVAD